jgi:hypothetical protein
MKKIVLALALLVGIAAQAQKDSTKPAQQPAAQKTKKDWSKLSLAGRPNDHILIQFGISGWTGVPDSIRISGFSRHFNAYFMWDFPFRGDPRFSVGLGVGIGSDNIFFKNTDVQIAATGTRLLPFRNTDSTDHFDKYKLVTTYLEAPVELRFAANPENTNKCFKASVGVKIGTMISAHTKGVDLYNKTGQLISPATYKVSDTRFFNSIRLQVTARAGYGPFSLWGAYQVSQFLKDGAGPDVRPFCIGLTLSGL